MAQFKVRKTCYSATLGRIEEDSVVDLSDEEAAALKSSVEAVGGAKKAAPKAAAPAEE